MKLPNWFSVIQPNGTKLLSWAVGIRWFGFGLVESLLPIYLLSFSDSYLVTGFLKSTFDIIFILFLPFVGIMSDRFSAKSILIVAALMYPLVGFSYFLAGAVGSIWLIIMARFLNGTAYAFDSVGRETYFRKVAPKKSISEMFGHFDFITSTLWVAGVAVSLIAVRHFSISSLYLLIIPASLLALFIIAKLPNDKHRIRYHLPARLFLSSFTTGLKNVRGGGTILALTFLLAVFGTISSFVIPVAAFKNGSSIPEVILLGLMSGVPSLFSVQLGKIADLNRQRALIAGILTSIAALLMISFANEFIYTIALSFILNLSINVASFALSGIATEIALKRFYGRFGSAITGADSFGELSGPLLLGLIADSLGLKVAIIAIACAALFMMIRIKAKNPWTSNISA